MKTKVLARQPGRRSTVQFGAGLGRAVFLACVTGALGAVALTVLLYSLVFGPTSHPPAATGLTLLDVIKVALAMVAGFGGAVALVVAYRRQDHLERDEAGQRELEKAYRDRYGAAAQQLGNAEPAVRLAGVYALANLADEWNDQRQQSVDVLCAYLRLPWADRDGSEAGTTVMERSWTEDDTQRRESNTVVGRNGEREVRRTLVRIINAHLQDDAPVSWSALDFDFRNGALPDANLKSARFKGTASFRGAKFTGTLNLMGASFEGNITDFGGATFAGEGALFSGASFSGDLTDFSRASFGGVRTDFSEVAFSSFVTGFGESEFLSDATDFGSAVFSSASTSFVAVTFSGRTTDFTKSEFEHETEFTEAVFAGETTTFGRAKFSGPTQFVRATFTGEDTNFGQAKFLGPANFSGAEFTGRATNFGKGEFAGPSTHFVDATFASEVVGFDQARFTGGNLFFTGSTCLGLVTFDEVVFPEDPPPSFEAVTFSGNPPPQLAPFL